ncbi:MAG TPA: hypothetical protein VGK02_00245 [Candidatus Aquicultor sp.]|jgi:hypothetical protein
MPEPRVSLKILGIFACIVLIVSLSIGCRSSNRVQTSQPQTQDQAQTQPQTQPGAVQQNQGTSVSSSEVSGPKVLYFGAQW